ncbi:hypothetical protein W04_3541 [Pseudoalteromonas sp. SW0106-04]|nr:hypothetical protein W04_3541 [Pseudoalteromonas sp. SW0106-04]
MPEDFVVFGKIFSNQLIGNSLNACQDRGGLSTPKLADKLAQLKHEISCLDIKNWSV